jgi:hypothetical protein
VKTTKHRLQTSHQITAGHWISTCRAFNGDWEVREIQAAAPTKTLHTFTSRDEAELIAEATAATRTHTGANA